MQILVRITSADTDPVITQHGSLCSEPSSIPHIRKGKVSRLMLPEEVNLDRLIQNLTNPHATWSTETRACDWDGVHCDESGTVTEIDWSLRQLRGELNFEYLPTSLETFNIERNEIYGKMPLSSFPSLPRIEIWRVMSNVFTR